MNFPKSLTLLATACALLAAPLSAQSEISETVGYLPATIRAGKSNTRAYTVLSLPLSLSSGASWKSKGHLSAITANTLTDSTKEWTAGQWSAPAAPWFIRLTSGAAAGRSFLLSTTTDNTATTLTLDPSEDIDLTTLGLATGEGDAGDTYEIFAAETLATVFPPENGVLGGTSTANADTIEINRAGVWTIYYHDATTHTWRESGSGNDASNVVIPPDGAFLYGRLAATPINLSLTGSVQGDTRITRISNSGQNLISNAWPVATTLADSGIQNLPGWVSAAAAASADKVQLHLNGVWQQYFHDGSHWRQIARGNPIKDTELIPAGSGVLLNRLGSATGSTALLQNAPF